MESQYYTAKNNDELSNDLRILLESQRLKLGGKCKVFDGQAWMKKGDVGNNDCYYVEATLLKVGRRRINEVIVGVEMCDGRLSNGHFLEGVRSYA